MRALVYAAGAYALCMGTAEAFAPQVSSPTLCRGPECKAGERAAPASALSMKIDYGAGYDPRNRPSAAVQPQQVESFGGQSTYTAAASFETAYNAPSAPAPRGKIDYGAPYDPRNRPVTAADSAPAAMSQAYSAAAPSAGDTSAVMSRVSDMMGAGSGPAAAPRRKIDYGAPYDPRNRPSAAPSYAPAAASDPVMSSASAGDLMTSAPRRKIDYGAPYDPRNRPVTTASAAPAAADAPAWSAAPAAAAAPAPRRKIDYGAPGYDPKNRGGPSSGGWKITGTMESDPLSSAPAKKWQPYGGYDPKRRGAPASSAPATDLYAPAADAFAAPAPSYEASAPTPVGRKIDYGAPGYDPKNRGGNKPWSPPVGYVPSSVSSSAPARKIDYGAPYDPRNRGGTDTLSRVEERMQSSPMAYVADSLESSYSGAPAQQVGRKIDYGAPGYVPASRR